MAQKTGRDENKTGSQNTGDDRNLAKERNQATGRRDQNAQGVGRQGREQPLGQPPRQGEKAQEGSTQRREPDTGLGRDTGRQGGDRSSSGDFGSSGGAGYGQGGYGGSGGSSDRSGGRSGGSGGNSGGSQLGQNKQFGAGADLEGYLDDVEFPATKQDIIDCCERNDAPESVMRTVQDLPDKRFDNLDQLREATSETKTQRSTHQT